MREIQVRWEQGPWEEEERGDEGERWEARARHSHSCSGQPGFESSP